MSNCNTCNKKTEIVFTSTTKLLEGCDTIVEYLRSKNIESKIYSNKVIKCNKDLCWADKECKIIIDNKEYYQCKKIWDNMSRKFNITCGHMEHEETL